MATARASRSGGKRPAPPDWAQRRRQGLGLHPRQRLNWLLDRLVYGPPASGLEDPAALGLWWDLLVLIEDATAEEWRPLMPQLAPTGPPHTSDDRGRATRSQLGMATSNLLKAARERARQEDAIEVEDGGRPLPRRTPAMSIQLLSDDPADAKRMIGAAQRRLRRYFLEGLPGRLGPVMLLPTRFKGGSRPAFMAPLSTAVVVAADALVRALPKGAVRRCPFARSDDGGVCGRLFVPGTNDRRCPDHRGAARREQWARATEKSRRRRQAAEAGSARRGNVPVIVPATIRNRPRPANASQRAKEKPLGKL
jgi:hypothetical protein